MARGAKPAVQQRARKTRDELISALDALLREKPFEEIEIADIAKRAGVSPASIYQRFTNKAAATAILLELNIRKVGEWSQAQRDAVGRIHAAPSLREAMLGLGALMERQAEALRYVMRPAYLHTMLRPDLFGEEWLARIEGARVAGFLPLLRAHQDEIARSNIEAASGTVAAICNMMFAGLLLHGEGGAGQAGFPILSGGFARELADMVCGYLKMPADGSEMESKTR